MPTYKFEAMDTAGSEVKDSVEASNEEEASQKIKAMGYFVTKLAAVQGGSKGAKKKKKAGGRRNEEAGRQMGPNMTMSLTADPSLDLADAPRLDYSPPSFAIFAPLRFLFFFPPDTDKRARHGREHNLQAHR